jgi:hypothetical protein
MLVSLCPREREEPAHTYAAVVTFPLQSALTWPVADNPTSTHYNPAGNWGGLISMEIAMTESADVHGIDAEFTPPEETGFLNALKDVLSDAANVQGRSQFSNTSYAEVTVQ